jgi:trigger factor
MIPLGVLSKIYGAKVLSEELRTVAYKEVEKFIKSENLDLIYPYPIPVGDFSFSDIDPVHLKDYTFSFEVGLKPVLEINPESINVIKYNVEITDEMIENEVTRLQLELGVLTDIQEVENDDSIINVEFSEVDNNNELIESGVYRETSLILKHFKDEFKSELIGKKVGDKVYFQLSDAFDDEEVKVVLNDLGLDKENIENKALRLELNIIRIAFVEIALLDEVFFEKAYPKSDIKTEEAFRSKLKESIDFYYEGQSKSQVSDQIYHFLLDEVKVDLPESFLIKTLELFGEKKTTHEEALAKYPNYSMQIKWQMIMSYFVKQENIKVLPEDIKKEAIKKISNYLGYEMQILMNEPDFLNEYIDKMLKDKKFLDDAYNTVTINKIFTSLESKVHTTFESIDAASFASKQHHHHF